MASAANARTTEPRSMSVDEGWEIAPASTPKTSPKTDSSWLLQPYVTAGGGMSTLLYNPQAGDYRVGFGGILGAGVGYNFRLYDKDFELSAGVEASLYNAKSTIDKFDYTSWPFRGYNAPTFQVTAMLMDYEETQRAVLLTVPIIVRYHFGTKYRYHAGAGAKIGVPIYSRYKVEQGTIRAEAPFDWENYTYDDPNLGMGFGTYSAIAADKSPIIKGTTFMLALEFGMQWRLSPSTVVNTSLYADIGLNNIKQSSTAPYFMSYYPYVESNQKIRTASIAASLLTDATGKPTGAMSKRIAPLAVGIKVTFYFGNKERKVPDTLPVRIDTIIKRDTIVKKDFIEMVVEKHDTIVIYDDTVPAPIPEPVAHIMPAPADTTLPKSMVYAQHIPDTVDAENAKPFDKKKKPKNKRSYQVQVLAARRNTDMSYFDVLREEYPQFKLRTIEVGGVTHYTYGVFSNFDEARRWAYRYVALGYTDVFVVQVENGAITKSFYNNK
jgi:hypothetical protein